MLKRKPWVNRGGDGRESVIILGAVAVSTLVLVAYSQTLSWFWDEGFHLLAGQLINSGRKPYMDFFYQHVPLYAYLNAGWMRLFGQTWRSAHLFSALLTAGCLLLVTRFVMARLPRADWRAVTAVAAALFTGLHLLVLNCGTIGEPYGLCLFLVVAAALLAVDSMARGSGPFTFGSGLAAGAAAAASLLSAPVAPILLVWLFRQSRARGRLRQCACFLGGTAIPFLPLLWLTVLAPRQAFFDVVRYHLSYRAQHYPNATHQDLKVLAELLASPQDVLLLSLAGLAVVFLADRSEWNQRQRADFQLCAWLAGILAVYLAVTHPISKAYFVLLVPFLGILAAVGIYAIGVRIAGSVRPAWLALPLITLFAWPSAKTVVQEQRSEWRFWQSMDETAGLVNRVTPKDGDVWANECVLFAARRRPGAGLENHHAQWLRLPAGLAAMLHVVPFDVMYKRLGEGRYPTVVIQSKDPAIESLGLPRLYAKRAKIFEYDVFWDAQKK